MQWLDNNIICLISDGAKRRRHETHQVFYILHIIIVCDDFEYNKICITIFLNFLYYPLSKQQPITIL